MSVTDEEILAVGTLVNGYQVERELGHGAMAHVYLATQLDLGRPVALKILSRQLSQDKDYVARFFNEARTAAALSHPHIIQAIDAGTATGGIFYFCMEYVDGETLLNVIRREEKVEPRRMRTWALEIADALNYGYHAHTFTHGDIKPENIMINSHGQAKLADFGLAKVEGHAFEGRDIMLTPLYAAPELIRGEKAPGDCRADIYAFGATLYHALAGTPPFPGCDAQAVLKLHLEEPLEPLVKREPSVPKDYSDLIGRMLAKSADERPQKWDDVIAGLEKLGTRGGNSLRRKIGHGDDGAAKITTPVVVVHGKDRRGSMWFAVGAVAVVGVGILLGAVFSHRRLEVPEPIEEPVVVKPELPPEEKPVQEVPVEQTENTEGEKVEKLQTVEAAQGGTPEETEAAEAVPQPTAVPEVEQLPPDKPLDFQTLTFELTKEQGEYLMWLDAAIAWWELRSETQGTRRRQLVKDWLMTHEGETGEAMSFMSFVDQEFLPQLMELLPAVMANKERVAGGDAYKGRDGKQYKIISLSSAGVQMDIRDRRSFQFMLVKWETLLQRGIMEQICQRAFADKDFAELRPFLAYEAMTGNMNLYSKLMEKYTGRQEAAMWWRILSVEQMGGDRDGRAREREALKSWRKICSCCNTGNRMDIYHLAADMLKANSKLSRVMKEPLVAMKNACEKVSVDYAVDGLLAEIEAMLEQSPSQAWIRLLALRGRYGLAEGFPAKDVERIGGRVLEAMQNEDWSGRPLNLLQGTAFYWPTGEALRLPRLLSASYSGMLKLSRVQEDTAQYGPKMKAVLEEPMMLMARLESGDWGWANQNKGRLDVKESDIRNLRSVAYGGAFQYASIIYSRALLEWRYGQVSKDMEGQLAQLPKMFTRDMGSWAGHLFNTPYQFWLLERHGEQDDIPGYIRRFTEDGAALGDNLKRRHAYLCLAVFMSQGKSEEAFKILDGDGESFKRLGFAPNKIGDDFKRLLEIARIGKGMAYPQVWDEEWMVEQLRFAMACMGDRLIDGKLENEFRSLVRTKGTQFSLLGGDVVFEWGLRRVAFELSHNRLGTALDTVNWALDVQAPCMFPYYARLLYLRAGIGLLAGQRGLALEAMEQVANATFCSENERLVLKLLLEPSKNTRVEINERHFTSFWFSWLKGCQDLAQGDTSVWETLAKAGRRHPQAEQLLVKGSLDIKGIEK